MGSTAPDRIMSPRATPRRATQGSRRPARAPVGQPVEGHEGPGQPGRRLDQVEVDALGRHEAAEGEGGGAQTRGQPGTAQEPEQADDAGGRHHLHRHLVEHPGQGAGQDGEEHGGGIGGAGVEAGQEGGAGPEGQVPTEGDGRGGGRYRPGPGGENLDEVVAHQPGGPEGGGETEEGGRTAAKRRRAGPGMPRAVVSFSTGHRLPGGDVSVARATRSAESLGRTGGRRRRCGPSSIRPMPGGATRWGTPRAATRGPLMMSSAVWYWSCFR